MPKILMVKPDEKVEPKYRFVVSVEPPELAKAFKEKFNLKNLLLLFQ
jgi:hypothetical protein